MFGTSSGGADLFGQSGSQSNGLFGSSSAFAQSGTQSLFGQSSAQSTFGQTGTQSAFGQSGAQSAFGQTGAVSPTFGQSGSQSLFGQSSGGQSGFGTQSSPFDQSKSLFGQSHQSSQPTGGFGDSVLGQTAQPTGLFGKPIAQTGPTGDSVPFGNQETSPFSGSTFGSVLSSGAATQGGFGQSASANSSGFGNTVPFGSSASSNPQLTSSGSGSAGAPSNPVQESQQEAPSIYTPMDKLTPEEIEQFKAPTFTVGKIPTKPPPKELCF